MPCYVLCFVVALLQDKFAYILPGYLSDTGLIWKCHKNNNMPKSEANQTKISELYITYHLREEATFYRLVPFTNGQ